jgi:hypothetical protein
MAESLVSDHYSSKAVIPNEETTYHMCLDWFENVFPGTSSPPTFYALCTPKEGE